MKPTLAVLLISLSSFIVEPDTGVNGDIFPFFDVSPEDNIALSINNGQSTLLYEYSQKDKKLTQLTESKTEQHIKPCYVNNGKSILYISKTTDSQKTSLKILHVETKKSEEILKTDMVITEMIFNPVSNEVLFCGAEFVGNYSPIARKAPHNIDIYSINLDGTNLEKRTNYNAYDLSSISINNSTDTVLCKITKNGEEKMDGIYKICLNDSNYATRVTAKNNPRPEIGDWFYNTPRYSYNSNLISFTAPYQLYTLNLETRECEMIWEAPLDEDQAQIISARFSKSNDKIIFSAVRIVGRKYSSTAEIHIVDLKTKEDKQVKIN